jgi:phosphatidate cytidylyltransferase
VDGRRTDVRRLYSAVVFLPLFYVLVRYLPPVALFGLVLPATLIALIEFYGLHFQKSELWPEAFLGCGGTAILLAAVQWPGFASERAVLLGTLALLAVVRMFSPRGLRGCLSDISVLATGVLYVGLTLACLLPTRSLPKGEFLILFLFLVTWATDTGSYYVGTLWGRRRLAPAISPNKTVEGLFGGIALAAAAALVGRAWLLPAFGWGEAVLLGLLLAAVAVLGDLAESAMKRSAGVKDSGGLIPAHGGMLDRLDSLLFTAPAFYYYVSAFKGATP